MTQAHAVAAKVVVDKHLPDPSPLTKSREDPIGLGQGVAGGKWWVDNVKPAGGYGRAVRGCRSRLPGGIRQGNAKTFP